MLLSAQSLGACAFIKKTVDSSFNQTVLTFNPITSISYNCWIWLDADDLRTAGAVTTWNDKSGKGYHCTQTIGSQKPTVELTNLQNKRPTLKFTSTSSQFLLGPTTFSIGTNSFYLFVVSKFNDTSTNFQGIFNKSIYGDLSGRFVCYKDNTGINMAIHDVPYSFLKDSNSNTDTTWNMYTLAVNRANAPRVNILNKNGSLVQTTDISYTTTPNLTNTSYMMVGAYNNTAASATPYAGSYLNGNIAEILGYAPSTNMSSTDIKRVEGYLAWKWGLQTKLPTNHPHYSAQPT